MYAALETPDRIEPCRLTAISERINDLVALLSAGATRLGVGLHPKSAASLADLVRIMNCYYSNLIEGHKTRPFDLEQAAPNDRTDLGRADLATGRDLQLTANAHIRVQRIVDAMAADGMLPEPGSVAFLQFLHREFYRDAPPERLLVDGAGRVFAMVPGAFRNAPEHDGPVRRHIPPPHGRVAAFMANLEERFCFADIGAGARILAIPAAHHRLNYIHPFPDGNGRVSRLMSHAMAHAAGIGGQGLWSVSRALARGLDGPTEYKRMMDHADKQRHGLDGHGHLSLRALEEFTAWFLETCLQQVTFMRGVFDLDGLVQRLRDYRGRRGRLRPEAAYILIEVLFRGEMPRGDAERVSGLKERTARVLLGELIDDGILGSATPKTPVSLRFPLHAVETLFPRLFPVG